jgi:hypothetical protein
VPLPAGALLAVVTVLVVGGGLAALVVALVGART